MCSLKPPITNIYLFQNLTLCSGNVNMHINMSEQDSEITFKLATSFLESFFNTVMASTLKTNPTNAKNAAKNPEIVKSKV